VLNLGKDFQVIGGDAIVPKGVVIEKGDLINQRLIVLVYSDKSPKNKVSSSGGN
jgi:hypothetical protein